MTIPSSYKFLPAPSTRFLEVGKIQKMEGRALERYILYYSEEERQSSRALWRTYSRRPDLISFQDGRSRQYYFDEPSLSYFETTSGRRRALPITSVKMDVNKFANEIQTIQRDLMSRLINGTITPQDWYNESIRMMKLAYLAAFNVARGSDRPADQEENYDWLLLILFLFLLLNETAKDLESGSTLINMRLPIKHGLLGGAVRTIFENKRRQVAVENGYTEARRILSIAEHCNKTELPGCVEEARRGWVPIATLVPLGGCTCRANCKCSVKYRRKP